MNDVAATLAQQERDRKERVDRILASTAARRVIVAGAGTGKTYVFRQILERAAGQNALVLTFINNLANDLKRDLGGLCEARTFHSYCKKLLHKTPSDGISFSFHFIPYLSLLVEQDARHLGDALAGTKARAFDEAFRILNRDDGRITFFLGRAGFYNAVGFDDSVYRVCEYLAVNREEIPEYLYVLVDEYQDFCALEVELIDLLAERSPTVIVGDDDQAIYDFRGSSRTYLQARARDGVAAVFDLPYCARCPDVVVRATCAIVAKASERGQLRDRVDKEYICYLPDKQIDSTNYPKIIDARCTVQNKRVPYLARYIERVLAAVPAEDREEASTKGYPLGLVIGPKHYLDQIYKALDGRVENMELRSADDITINVLDGYRILMDDADANLGWRIVAAIFANTKIADWLRQAAAENRALSDVIDDAFKKEHREVVANLKAVRAGQALQPDAAGKLEGRLGLTIPEISKRLHVTTEEDNEASEQEVHVPQLKFTTYNGCKGLSAGFVFVVGLDRGELPRNTGAPTDTEICQFIVALTRTRKQCHLLSVNRFGGGDWRPPSEFLEWLPEQYRQVVVVDKAYFLS